MRRAALCLLLLVSSAGTELAADDPSPGALIEAGHWKRAQAVAEARLKANPNDVEAAYLLSRVKLAFGDLDGALPLAEKAVALEGRSADHHYQLASVYGSKAQRASFFSQMGLAKQFRKEAEAALALDPKNVEALLGMMEYYAQAPGIIGGDKNKAHALAEQITQINPARGYLAQAQLAAREKDSAKLEGLYLKALEANPRLYEVRMSLAGFYGADSQKKYEVAERHAREALNLDPGRGGAYAGLAQLFVVQQRWNDLDAILVQAEKNVPDNLNPYYQAGRILLVQGKDLSRAERYFRKYLTQEPEGNAPTLAHAHWRLGLVQEKQGRKAEAIAELETALRMKPDLEAAKNDLKRLK